MSSTTSTTSRSGRPRRVETAREYERYGFAPGGVGRVEVGGAFVVFHEGDPGEPERPLLNHLAVLVDSADGVIADAPSLGIEVESVVDAANTYAAFLWGPGACAHRVRRAQADVLVDVVQIAGAGMAGLVAAARLRELGRAVTVLREGHADRRFDAPVVRRHLAASRLGRVSARVPDR